MPAPIALDTDVRFLKGVGPVRAAEFARLGVRTVHDLLFHLPFRYDHRPKSIPIGDVEPDEPATVVGELRKLESRPSSSGPLLSGLLVDGTGRCRVRWFNSGYLEDKLHPGAVVRVSGRAEAGGSTIQFTNPQTLVVDEKDDPFGDDRDRFEPVYSATAELPSRWIHRLIRGVLDVAVKQVSEVLPLELLTRRALPSLPIATRRLHAPTTIEETEAARRRLAYDELLQCQLAVHASRRQANEAPPATPLPFHPELDRRIRRRFPFSLTEAQDRAVREIVADLGRPRAMNRLLQADVGAGKTAVAVYAALVAVADRRQVALLAPTEVLARQHFDKLAQYLKGSRVRTALLTGSTPRSDRPRLLAALRGGDLDVIVGTHALLEKGVVFHDLALAVIDEQHKFGVAQRATLRSKAVSPHVLVLTATPIPRTLAMTYFGDLDVSVIDAAPPGRVPVVTRLVTSERRGDAWDFVRKQLDSEARAYVVLPVIEEKDGSLLRAAKAEARRLAEGELRGHAVEPLHGRLRAEDKAAVLERFRSGRTRVLVATTVIEVGVDVPEAVLMIIDHAERYGLSQLHQLRGRVGRGSRKSYCLLMTDSNASESLRRLNMLCESRDGFRLAEEDLRMRGPGEWLGTRQHGAPLFKVANLATDVDLLTAARDDAAQLLESDPTLSLPRHAALRSALHARYGDVLGFTEVA